MFLLLLLVAAAVVVMVVVVMVVVVVVVVVFFSPLIEKMLRSTTVCTQSVRQPLSQLQRPVTLPSYPRVWERIIGDDDVDDDRLYKYGAVLRSRG